MEEISSKCCRFFKHEKLVLQVFEISNFKVKMCGRKFFDSLKVWGAWRKGFWVVKSVKFQVCQRNFFALLQVSSEISSLCNKRFASDKSFFFSSLHEGSKISSKTFNLLRECLLLHLCSKCLFFKWNPWKSWRSLMVATFTFESSKCAWCFLNMGFGNLLMGVLPCQVKKLQRPITTRKRWRLLHCFVNISRMPNLHTFNIVTMWEVRARLFMVCMKLRQLVTSCSFERDFSPSKCKKEWHACAHQQGENPWGPTMFHRYEHYEWRCLHGTPHEPSFILW